MKVDHLTDEDLRYFHARCVEGSRIMVTDLQVERLRGLLRALPAAPVETEGGVDKCHGCGGAGYRIGGEQGAQYQEACPICS